MQKEEIPSIHQEHQVERILLIKMLLNLLVHGMVEMVIVR